MSVKTDVAKISAIWRGNEAPNEFMERRDTSSVDGTRPLFFPAWRNKGEREAERNRPRVYISGPITGIPSYNRAAFAEAECSLRRIGYKVFNPLFPGLYPDYDLHAPREVHLRRGIAELLQCDCVALLPGYMGTFAETEAEIAKNLGMPIFSLREGMCGLFYLRGKNEPTCNGRKMGTAPKEAGVIAPNLNGRLRGEANLRGRAPKLNRMITRGL